MKRLADYKDMVFVPCAPPESPKMREALLEADGVLNAIYERIDDENKQGKGDFARDWANADAADAVVEQILELEKGAQ